MNPPITVVGIVFPDFELLDLFGPYELFGMLKEQVQILTAAEAPGIVRSSQGPKIVADVGLNAVAAADVMLVPGGQGTRPGVNDEVLLKSIAGLAARSRIVAGVCTGSALLAKAGILDGRRATSNKRAFEWVTTQSQRVSWVRRARWVEDGSYFTSSGVSAGMDMTLAVIQHLFDQATAERVATGAEYTWHRDAEVDPFSDLNERPANG